MSTAEHAEKIARILRAIVPAEVMERYLADENGNRSLRGYENMAQIRMGVQVDRMRPVLPDWWQPAWDEAMGLLR